MARKKIAVIGSSVVDLYLIGLGNWPERDGERARVREIRYLPGGNGLNVAINLAKLGSFDVSLFTAIGHGAQGEMLQDACKYWDPLERPRQALEGEVHLPLATVPGHVQTTLSIVRLNENNEPTYLYCPGASAYITGEFLETHLVRLSNADLLYLAGLGTHPNLPLTALSEITTKVRQRSPNIRILADVNLLSQEQASANGIDATIMALLGNVDYFLPNEFEALQYSGEDNIAQAARRFNRLARAGTVVKRGEKGVVFFDKDASEPEVVPAYSDLQIEGFSVKDAVGAGDAWGAGFAASLLRGKAVADACLFGNALAAHCIQEFGATTNTRPYEAIEELMAEYGKPEADTATGTPPQVFICYSHKDQAWKERLVTQLRVLADQGLLAIWDDQQIDLGDNWKQQIDTSLENAKAAVLLISADFLTSKFITGEEVPDLLVRRDREGLRMFPVIIKPCPWREVKWLAEMQCYPKDRPALSGGDSHQVDTDLAQIATQILHLLKRSPSKTSG